MSTAIPVLSRVLVACTVIASSAASSSTAPSKRWPAPMEPVRITRGYDPPAHNWLSGHRGIDLRATPGQLVRAAGSGKVTYAGLLAGRHVVSIEHDGLRTTYEPVRPSVGTGDVVKAGSVIGEITAGAGHCGSGSCLHFGVRRGRTYLNPLLLLLGWQAVLRPPPV